MSVGNGTLITGMTLIKYDVTVEMTLHVANPISRIGIGPEENNVIKDLFHIPYTVYTVDQIRQRRVIYIDRSVALELN